MWWSNNPNRRQVLFWWWTDSVILNQRDGETDIVSEEGVQDVVSDMRRAILQLKGEYMNEQGYNML